MELLSNPLPDLNLKKMKLGWPNQILQMPLMYMNSYGKHHRMEDNIQWKLASNGREPPKEEHFQQKKASTRRQHPLEDDCHKRPPI